jgi:hypothetical protein
MRVFGPLNYVPRRFIPGYFGGSTGDKSYTLPRRDVKRVGAAWPRRAQGPGAGFELPAQSVSNLVLSGLGEQPGVGQH